jgi:hypothetical protein
MVRVGAKLLLLVVLASWFAPAALASYTQPSSCCHRGNHHCTSGTEEAFRSTKIHCQSCQAVITAHQAPRPAENPTLVSPADEHPFIHEFSSALSVEQIPQEHGERAPPAPPAQ